MDCVVEGWKEGEASGHRIPSHPRLSGSVVVSGCSEPDWRVGAQAGLDPSPFLVPYPAAAPPIMPTSYRPTYTSCTYQTYLVHILYISRHRLSTPPGASSARIIVAATTLFSRATDDLGSLRIQSIAVAPEKLRLSDCDYSTYHLRCLFPPGS
jgi:hypothetical protein